MGSPQYINASHVLSTSFFSSVFKLFFSCELRPHFELFQTRIIVLLCSFLLNGFKNIVCVLVGLGLYGFFLHENVLIIDGKYKSAFLH